MKLKQLASNMTELELNDGTRVLFSYETPVAAFSTFGFKDINDQVKIIITDKKWSNTTTKHINKWKALQNQDTNMLRVDQSVLDALVS